MSPGEARPFSAALSQMPTADWAAAIVARRSSRTFDGRPVDGPSLNHLEQFCFGLPGGKTARINVLPDVPKGLFTGIVGGYGRVVKAPSALVMIGSMDDPAVQESMGYLGEAALLEATSLGVDTCWIGGFFDKNVAREVTNLSPGESILAVSPLGYRQNKARRGERFLKQVVRAHKRRPIEEIAVGFDEAKWPAWAAEGVRLLRVAPSAVNRQPWSISLIADGESQAGGQDARGAILSVVRRGIEGNVSRRMDCGIAMLHFEVGARLMGASGRWETLEEPQVARYVLPIPE